MTPLPLFSNKPFATYAANSTNTARAAAAALKQAHFASNTAEELATAIYQNNALASLFIDTENITQAYLEEIKIDTPDSTTNSGHRLVDGRRFTFNIPFMGSPDLLTLVPAGAEGEVPFGNIDGNFIHFQLEQLADGNIEDIISQFLTNRNGITGYAGFINTNIADFNTSLQQLITTAVAARKARLDKLLADAELIGVPIAA